MKGVLVGILAICVSTSSFAAMSSDMMSNATELARIVGRATGRDACGPNKDASDFNSDRSMDLFLRLATKCGASNTQEQTLTRTLEQEHNAYSGDGCEEGGQKAFWHLMNVMPALEQRLYADASSCEEDLDPSEFPSE